VTTTEALQLSVIYTRLLHDLEELGHFEFAPDEVHQAVQLLDDMAEQAHRVKQATQFERDSGAAIYNG
jgi:hypothetical protein